MKETLGEMLRGPAADTATRALYMPAAAVATRPARRVALSLRFRCVGAIFIDMNMMHMFRNCRSFVGFAFFSAFIALCAAPCLCSTLNKAKQVKPAPKATAQRKKAANKEPKLVFYRTNFGKNGYGKTDVKAGPSRKAETVEKIWYDGVCVTAYPGEKKDGAEKWVRLYPQADNGERWVLLKRLKPSRECKEAYDLAGELYKVVAARFKEALQENDRNKRYVKMDKLPIEPWTKKHLSKTVWSKSTYDNRINDFCKGGRMYCNFHYFKTGKETIEYMKVDIGEKFSLVHDFAACSGNPKQCFISLLKLGVEKNNIIFFHSPGAAHNNAWYFSKRNGKWKVSGFAVITD